MLKRVLLTLVFLVLLTACASKASQPETELTVEMSDFSYSPSSITLPAGAALTTAK